MIMLACMMKRIIGFEELYTDGFEPSRMPPCGGALAVAVLVADVTVVVSISVTVLVSVAMLNAGMCLSAPDERCQYCAFQEQNPGTKI